MHKRIALISLWLMACGSNSHTQNQNADGATDSDGGGSTTAPTQEAPMTPEEFLRRLTEAQCALVSACRLLVEGGAEVNCEARLYDRLLAPLASVRAGNTRFDANAALRCLTSLAGASCNAARVSELVAPIACEQVFVGVGANGSACTHSRECGLDSFCQDQTGFDRCPRTCAARAADGQSCRNVACSIASRCNQATALCERLQLLGDPCSSTEQCRRGLVCRDARCQDSNLEISNVGQACDLSLFIACAEGLACDSVRRVCVQRLSAGQSCVGDTCERGLICDGRSNTCVQVLREGDACNDFCNMGYCYQGRCELNRLGSACVNDLQCTTNRCRNSVCVEPVDGCNQGAP